VDRADALMYDRKRQRKIDRDAAALQIASGTATIDPMRTGNMAALVAQKERD
jgi:hypothetical protein